MKIRPSDLASLQCMSIVVKVHIQTITRQYACKLSSKMPMTILRSMFFTIRQTDPPCADALVKAVLSARLEHLSPQVQIVRVCVSHVLQK